MFWIFDCFVDIKNNQIIILSRGLFRAGLLYTLCMPALLILQKKRKRTLFPRTTLKNTRPSVLSPLLNRLGCQAA